MVKILIQNFKIMYKNSFSRKNPGLVVIMVDQSGSMCYTSKKNGLSLAENAANSVNNLINEFILKLSTTSASGEEVVKSSIKLVVIGYGGPNDEAYIICDDMIDKIAEDYPMGKVKISTREGLFEQDCIEVVQPVADTCTPMAWAMSLAKDEVSKWLKTHNTPEDPVPVIINISDGIPTDSEEDVKKYADDIKNMTMPDGNPRIFNIHISDESEQDIRFPKDKGEFADNCAELLFDISSEVTQDLIQSIPELVNSRVQGGEKMMMSNVSDPVVLLNFLKIGTLQKLR